MKRKLMLVTLGGTLLLTLTACAPSSKSALEKFLSKNKSDIKSGMKMYDSKVFSSFDIDAKGENTLKLTATLSKTVSKELEKNPKAFKNAKTVMDSEANILKSSMQKPLKEMKKAGIKNPIIEFVYKLSNGKTLDTIDLPLDK